MVNLLFAQAARPRRADAAFSLQIGFHVPLIAILAFLDMAGCQAFKSGDDRIHGGDAVTVQGGNSATTGEETTGGSVLQRQSSAQGGTAEQNIASTGTRHDTPYGSVAQGGVSTSQGSLPTSQGGASTSQGGVSTSLGGASTPQGGASTPTEGGYAGQSMQSPTSGGQTFAQGGVSSTTTTGDTITASGGNQPVVTSGASGSSSSASVAQGGLDAPRGGASSGSPVDPCAIEDTCIDDFPDSTTDCSSSLEPTIIPWSGAIDVCFELASSATKPGFSEEQQNAIRRAVTDSWSRVSGIQFVNFDRCHPPPTAPSQVVVRVDTQLPANVLATTDTLGRAQVADRHTTVSFASPDPSQRTIIHVFGHVLGFLHPTPEQSCSTRADAGAANLSWADSVMSQTAAHTASDLTPWDVVAAQRVYSRHAPGALVGMNAQCLDISVPTEETWSVAQVYACHGGDNQQWRLRPDGAFYCPGYANLLLDVYNGQTTDGTEVEMWEWDSIPPPPNQSWSFDRVELRGIGNLCVGTGNSSVSDGHLLQIQNCRGASNQQWKVGWVSDDQAWIQTAGSVWCIQAPQTPGEKLDMALCSGDARQIFTIKSSGQLVNNGLCLSTAGAAPESGRELILEPCLGEVEFRLHQQFSLRGPLASALGKCLTTTSTDVVQHDHVYIQTCADTPDFIWDYYFNPP